MVSGEGALPSLLADHRSLFPDARFYPQDCPPMTYCLSLLCREGIVCISDSRTSAGVDNINVRPKMRIFSEPGNRVICLMTSGNLSVTQSVIALIEEDAVRARSDSTVPHLLNQPTMFETARYVGRK